MRSIHLLLLFLLPFLPISVADIEFTFPSAGSIIRAGDVITAQWRDSGEGPRISELSEYDLFLCAGKDTAGSYEEVATLLLKDVAFSRGNSVSFKLDADAGGNVENIYFLKMVASGPGISVINYSPHFTLTSMAGTFSPILVHGAHSLPHTSAFSEIGEEFRKQQAAGVDPGVAGLGVGARVGARDTDDNPYTIPYQLQTGPTRYAPMAKKPGTSITAKTATPQYPTSSYEIATSYLPQPTVQVTISAPLTYSTSSIENTASPAAQPVDAKMKRFLERWKD